MKHIPRTVMLAATAATAYHFNNSRNNNKQNSYVELPKSKRVFDRERQAELNLPYIPIKRIPNGTQIHTIDNTPDSMIVKAIFHIANSDFAKSKIPPDILSLNEMVLRSDINYQHASKQGDEARMELAKNEGNLSTLKLAKIVSNKKLNNMTGGSVGKAAANLILDTLINHKENDVLQSKYDVLDTPFVSRPGNAKTYNQLEHIPIKPKALDEPREIYKSILAINESRLNDTSLSGYWKRGRDTVKVALRMKKLYSRLKKSEKQSGRIARRRSELEPESDPFS